jgi:hypothetical protein
MEISRMSPNVKDAKSGTPSEKRQLHTPDPKFQSKFDDAEYQRWSESLGGPVASHVPALKK